MAEQHIPAELHDFILRHIDSIAQLEALLLLHGSAGQGWDAESVAKRLYTPLGQARDILESLREDGFSDMTAGEYRYTGGSVEQRKLVDQLAPYYASHLVLVTNLIHSKPRRIREFAKAFRLKRDH